jgi:hypothetical protein
MTLSIVAFGIMALSMLSDFVIQCNAMPSVVTLSVIFMIMLSAVMPSDILPSIVRLNVVILNVVVPDCQYKSVVKFP